MTIVRFPDGTELRAAAFSERRQHDTWRDFGLYLDPAWRPTWPSALIPWKDFGLPKSSQEAVDQICAAFKRAKAGQHVEVGCIGGCGRTGTVLACIAVLAGVAPSEAVSWIRAHYMRRAVETPEQEQWVLWFAEQVKRDLKEGPS